MPDISSSLSKREVNARQNTYTKSEIDLKDGAIQAIAEAAQTTADAAEKKNQEQDQLIAELQKSSHSHSNQDVLDKTEQPYTTAERDKLAGLENYTHPEYKEHSSGLYGITIDHLGHVTFAYEVGKSTFINMGLMGSEFSPKIKSTDNNHFDCPILLWDGKEDCGGSREVLNVHISNTKSSTDVFSHVTLEIGNVDNAQKVYSSILFRSGVYSSVELCSPITSEERHHTSVYLPFDTGTLALEKNIPKKASELENDAGYGTYTKPAAGIPKSDLASGVQASLGKADTALQKHQDISGKLDKTGDASNTTVTFSAASARENVKTGEKLSVILGKIAKWFADLKTVAFTGSYNDLANKPTIPDGSKYLPLAGGVMNGDIDLASNGVDLLVGTQRAAQGTYASAVAGATVAAKEPLKTGLSKRKSLIGSWLDQNSAWHSILSVRHRNGWTDGPSYGFYLRSLLTSSGDLYWNKQTGVDKWQGERVLLDSANYSRYAAPLSHAHRDIDQIGNVGYYGSDEANSDGWYKIYSGKLTGYADRVARLSIVRSYGRGHGIVLFHLRCDNNSSIKIHDLLWETRYKFDEKHIAIKTNGNEYGIYVYQSSIQWGRIKVRVLESCGTLSNWTMTLSSNSTKESSFTPTATAKDGGTVAKAKEADTLTDSGWVAMTVEGYAKSGTVKYRTYGKQITITGSVVLKNDIATSYPAPQYIASTTFDFSKIVGCSGVGRSSSGVGAYVAVENYNGDNLVCVYALGSKIAAGATLYFTITGLID